MKRTNVEQVLILANVYIKEGMISIDAIKKSEIEVRKLEREKYEK